MRFLRSVFNNCGHVRYVNSSVIDILPEIKNCLFESKPIVALESTIITHGMPYPANLETTLECQRLIRKEGSIPALIAVLKGRVKVGLTEGELIHLAQNSSKAVKVSRRDFPYVIGNKLDGGTTVSGTVIVASAVGIKVFATGGIGGVHRGGEQTMDISADLQELGRNPIMVVSSGIKSILDIGRTLEYLETSGVLVAVYSNSKSMPAFFSKNSSFEAPYQVNSPEEASLLIQGIENLGLKSGVLLAVPIPADYSLDYDLMERHINKAIEEADQQNIIGKKITPYLLDKISHLTQGKSLESNIALIKNNSVVAARIASCYSKLGDGSRCDSNISPKVLETPNNPVIIGGSVIDITVHLDTHPEYDGRTVPAVMEECCGGVGRNLADAIGKLGSKPSFLSAVGEDRSGKTILQSISHIDCDGVDILKGENTASYMVLLDSKGDCLLCAGNSNIHDKTDINQVNRYLHKLQNSNFIILDSNLSKETMEYIVGYGTDLKIPIWAEPTSLLKCHKILSLSHKSISFISPNLNELKQMASFIGVNMNEEFDHDNIDKLLEQVIFLYSKLSEVIPSTFMITMGKRGTLVVGSSALNNKPEQIKTARYYPASHPPNRIINSSGAGDCEAAAFISGLTRGLSEHECINFARQASLASLLSKFPVPESFHNHQFHVDPAECVSINLNV